MESIEGFRDSDEWIRSMGIGMLNIHFREKEGTGHAVCDRNTGLCDVHYDEYNPHERLFAHLWNDSPEVVWGGLLAGISVAGIKPLFDYVRGR